MSEIRTAKKTNFTPMPESRASVKGQSQSSQLLSTGSDNKTKKSTPTHGVPVKSTAGSSTSSKKPNTVPTSYTVDSKPSVSRREIKIFNEAGEDVTPRPLLQTDAGSRKGPLTAADTSSGGTPTDLQSQNSFFQPPGTTASTFGPGGFSKSVFSASESGRSSESLSEEFGDPIADLGASFTDMRVEFKHEEKVEVLTDEDLTKVIQPRLTETATMWLLDMPSICALSESEEAPKIIEQNLRYQELTKNKAGNDRYVERSMNTFNDALKNKMTQTTKLTHKDESCYATIWDMYDTYNELKVVKPEDDDEIVLAPEKKIEPEEETQPQLPRPSTSVPPLTAEVAIQPESATVSSFGVNSTIMGLKKKARQKQDAEVNNNEAEILQSDDLKRHLVIMERIINLNTYQPKQASYRNFPILPDVDRVLPAVEVEKPSKRPAVAKVEATPVDLGPGLERLWSYQSSMMRGRNVSCIAWNQINPDLVAVGYGQFEYMKQKGGLVCCWSVKNPEYPERVYPTSSGVMSVAFSQAHPNLLAAGLYDGTVAIFNVCLTSNEPVLDSCEATGKHTGPVWQLRWIEKERGSSEERVEVLVSISTDGRVTQWAIRKGFESYDLIKLKRVTEKNAPSAKAKRNDALISKFAGGLCFDFSSKDSNIYLVGTEDGHIHRCSCSYNEQYLDSYFGHTGPVYCVRWSPIDSNVFISSSADWTIRLWHQDRLQPILNLLSSTKAVLDLCWSPKASTVFACVNEGALDVWDLAQNTLDPILVNVPSSADVKISAVSFARNTDCLLVGDSEGQVTVFQLRGMQTAHVENQMDALQQVITSSLASQLKN